MLKSGDSGSVRSLNDSILQSAQTPRYQLNHFPTTLVHYIAYLFFIISNQLLWAILFAYCNCPIFRQSTVATAFEKTSCKILQVAVPRLHS